MENRIDNENKILEIRAEEAQLPKPDFLHIHYLPQKTKGTQKDNSETVTPLVRYAFDIIKETQLNLPILRYPFGKSGYNKKISSFSRMPALTAR